MTGIRPGASASGPAAPNPFVGLRRFDVTDSHLFFGRDEQTYHLLRRLRLMHFLAVIGPSGCGKSSLIRAGVMAALRDGFLADDGDWRLVTLQPGNGPLEAWVAALRPHVRPGTTDEAIVANPAAVLDTRPGPMAILVDQFEELFQFVARTGRTRRCPGFRREHHPDGRARRSSLHHPDDAVGIPGAVRRVPAARRRDQLGAASGLPHDAGAGPRRDRHAGAQGRCGDHRRAHHPARRRSRRDKPTACPCSSTR